MQSPTTIDPALTRPGRGLSRTQTLLAIFAFALSIRWAYDLILFSQMGDQWLMIGDSAEYTGTAKEFVELLFAGTAKWADWLGTGPYRMPLFHWLAAIPYMLFPEKYAVLGYVMMQGAIDAGTCVIVFLIAELISPAIARAAGIVAAFNPTQIVLAGIFYTDTPFTFFFAFGFLHALRWCASPNARNAALTGIGFGCAALVRAIIVPWGAFALIAIAFYVAWTRSLKFSRSIVLGALIFSSAVGLILSKNYVRYGTLRLSPQAGIYYTGWVVPLAREMYDRRPFFVTFDELQKRTRERFGSPSSNPFEQSDRLMIVGREAAANIPWHAFVRSFASGIFINLSSPGILLSPPVLYLPRTGFYESQGDGFFDKVYNYAFNSGNRIYLQILLAGAIGILLARLVQICGGLSLLFNRTRWLATLFAGSWASYLLLVAGPIASPKYRLPLEPVFDIAMAAGIMFLMKRRSPKSPPTGLPSQISPAR